MVMLDLESSYKISGDKLQTDCKHSLDNLEKAQSLTLESLLTFVSCNSFCMMFLCNLLMASAKGTIPLLAICRLHLQSCSVDINITHHTGLQILTDTDVDA